MFRKTIFKTILLIIISAVITGAVAFGYFAFAAEKGCTRNTSIRLQVPILGYKCVNDFPAYIMFVYRFMVGSIGLVAVVMIMVGGMEWILAAGNSQKIEGAKTTIFSAVAGLLIAISSFTILNIISPNLTSLKVGALPKVTGKLVLYETCPVKPTFACGWYFKRNDSGDIVGNPLPGGGKYKNIIEEWEDSDNVCRGIYCDTGGDPNKKAGCYPRDLGNDELGDLYHCTVVKCPTDKEKVNRCLWYYDGKTTIGSDTSSDIYVNSLDVAVQEKMRYQACIYDLCDLSEGKNCPNIFCKDSSTSFQSL